MIGARKELRGTKRPTLTGRILSRSEFYTSTLACFNLLNNSSARLDGCPSKGRLAEKKTAEHGVPSVLSDALGRRLPLTHRQLDYVVVASGGDEQVGALPRVIERF